MKASDMLDLLHFYLEEDLFEHGKELEVRNAVRSHLYGEFYGVTYLGPQSGSSTEQGYVPTRNAEGLYVGDDDEEADDPLQPVNPRAKQAAAGPETKPYIPPTQFDHDADDPFASALSPDAVRRMRSR